MDAATLACAPSGMTWDGRHQLGRCSTSSKTAASAYCEGNTGRQTQQGESLAMVADPLVQRQSISRQASD